VNLKAAIANSLWSAANLPSYYRFHRALQRPEIAQQGRLQAYLEQNAQTAFGRAHDFNSIRSYEDFTKRVPLMGYEDYEPWIERIRRGEPNVLTREPVTRLVPTSGSTGARKLIPFTAGLQHEFNAAIGPWLIDLLSQSMGIAGGPAYWSITPVMADAGTEISEIPIGFDTDTAYLGGARQRLAAAVMAVPDALRLIKDMEIFRYVTLLCLLRQRELRLISVWHPSFLSLLLDAPPANWEALLADIRDGTCKYISSLSPIVRAALNLLPLPRRANELQAIGPDKRGMLWPHLKLISCWGDASAQPAAAVLKSLFPDAMVQPKGLLATEAFVTIPFAGQYPIAVQSHFFEFIEDTGAIFRAQELRAGRSYEVVVTTAGGLWRYRLRDLVEVTGFVGRTPSLRFLGRSGNVSDLFGEKLSEGFAGQAIQEMLSGLDAKPKFVLLAPDQDEQGCRYTLYVEGRPPGNVAELLDRSLRRNPHYANCRDLGQLQPIRLFLIADRGYETFVKRETTEGSRLGDVKPALFSRKPGWSTVFSSESKITTACVDA
jgi:hypothetical protein